MTATKQACLQGVYTGATGLEPATSGVTGRYELERHSRLLPGTTRQSRDFPAD